MDQDRASTRQLFSRRTFLSTSAKAAALVGSSALLAVATGAEPLDAEKGPETKKGPEAEKGECPRINIFSKHLQWLNYQGMAETAAEIGFDGVDLTVRPKGHVEPERVEDDLPRAVEAVKRAGLRVEMMVSSVKDPREEHTETVLKTAANQGIKYYRMGYHHFDFTRDIATQLEEIKPVYRDLAAMNQELGLAATYQNHSGEKYVGASLWDLYDVIRDLDPRWMGSQFDVRHAVTEGGNTWSVALRLLSRFINTLAIKDLVWVQKGNQWRTENVPLGEGMVDFPKFAGLLKQLNIQVPISLHIEYPIAGANHGARKLSGEKSIVLDAMRRDLAFVRGLFA